mmetsp:Transcript_84230/g.272618  ORF Transcript_84230/g.272618 Transcript_84230/m.272618 type:complete len:206 (-) Transcript_84230:6-623(-)
MIPKIEVHVEDVAASLIEYLHCLAGVVELSGAVVQLEPMCENNVAATRRAGWERHEGMQAASNGAHEDERHEGVFLCSARVCHERGVDTPPIPSHFGLEQEAPAAPPNGKAWQTLRARCNCALPGQEGTLDHRLRAAPEIVPTPLPGERLRRLDRQTECCTNNDSWRRQKCHAWWACPPFPPEDLPMRPGRMVRSTERHKVRSQM